MWKDIWAHLQESKATLNVYNAPVHKILALSGIQEPDALAWVPVLVTDISVVTGDWTQRKRCHHSACVRWYIAEDARVPLKHSELVNTLTECLVCSKQHSRQVPKEPRAMHWSSQPVKDWQIDYVNLFILSKSSKYALVYMDTANGLTQAFLVVLQTKLPLLGDYKS